MYKFEALADPIIGESSARELAPKPWELLRKWAITLSPEHSTNSQNVSAIPPAEQDT